MHLKIFASCILLLLLVSSSFALSCYLSDLKSLQTVLGKRLKERIDESQNNCDDVIKKLINFTSREKNTLNRTYFKEKSETIFDQSELGIFAKETMEELQERERLWLELQKYQPLDENFNDKSLCSLSNSNGGKVISRLDEMFNILFETEKPTDDSCQMIKYFVKVEDIIKRRLEKDQLETAIENAYRNRNIDDIYTKIVKQVSELNATVKEKQKESAIELLQKGFFEGYSLLKKLNDHEAKEVLEKAYGCRESNLFNVVDAISHDKNMLKKIVDKVKKCPNGAKSTVLIYINSKINNELEDMVEQIYEKLATLKDNELKNQIDKLRVLDDLKSLDLAKLIELMYKCDLKNFDKVLEFIDESKIHNKKIETVFYDEFIKCDHIDTRQHVDFGFWLQKKVNEANDNIELTKKRAELQNVRERLPAGIELLVFAEYVIFAQESYEQILRAHNHVAVKFKVYQTIDKENNEEVYGIRDVLNENLNNIFLNKVKKYKKVGYEYKLTGGEDLRMEIGGDSADHSTDYQWQIIPTMNATRFYLYHPKEKAYVSNEEIVTRFKESFNVAFTTKNRDDQKWMITEKLIRNNPLDDRSDLLKKHRDVLASINENN